MISWEYFKSVRKLKVKEWMANVGIKSYDDLVRVLRNLGVKPPSLDDVVEYFAKPKPKVKPKPKPKPEPKPVEETKVYPEEPKPKPRRRRKTVKPPADGGDE